MIPVLLSLALQAVVPLPTTLGTLPRQVLPKTGCAAFLWSREDVPRLLAMDRSEPATLRIVVDGATVDLPRVAADGATGLGFASSATYAAGDISATLELAVTVRDDLQRGGVVGESVLRVARAGHDALAVPVGGLVGCA